MPTSQEACQKRQDSLAPPPLMIDEDTFLLYFLGLWTIVAGGVFLWLSFERNIREFRQRVPRPTEEAVMKPSGKLRKGGGVG
jgi:hypothetical protein